MSQQYSGYQISKLNKNLESLSIVITEPFDDIRLKNFEIKPNDLKKKTNFLEDDIELNYVPNLILKDLDLVFIKKNIKDWLEKEKKSRKKNPNFNLACSPGSIVYTLPSNLELLENLTCIEYLSRYTTISDFRAKTIIYLFNKYKTDDLNPLEKPYIERKDLIRAVIEFHGNSVNSIDEMMEVLDLNKTKNSKILDEKSNFISVENFINNYFKFDEFQAIIAFSERFFSNFFSNDGRNLLEQLDLNLAFKKIEIFRENKKLENLLKFLFDSKKP